MQVCSYSNHYTLILTNLTGVLLSKLLPFQHYYLNMYRCGLLLLLHRPDSARYYFKLLNFLTKTSWWEWSHCKLSYAHNPVTDYLHYLLHSHDYEFVKEEALSKFSYDSIVEAKRILWSTEYAFGKLEQQKDSAKRSSKGSSLSWYGGTYSYGCPW